ncbi:hypothetical protein SCL_2774 [Sulfuricaulis limicola]|uniref:Transmembrane protein n=1 Tax=Sulfuricaulis limicola TaxID=1620215 RepID=A0A1B4XJS5_9GAMM|nr:hypothetical protein [Sulfuricaulis limicola]BAV35051.1 hypothetical protein SCL_2774 [Sulfuricaulis limicola]
MSAPADDNGTTGSGPAQAGTWIACGQRLVRQQPSLWYGMAAVYIVLGFLLTLIPFMGHLLLILITPMLLAGVIWGRAHPNPAEPESAPPLSSAQALLQTWVAQPTQELLRIFSHEGRLFGAVLLGIVTLGLVMAVKIVGYLLIGGSMISGLTADLAGGTPFITFAGMVLVAGLSVLLGMALLYSVPLTVLGNRQPLDAIAESFSACREHARPLLILVAPFFLVYVVILVAFANSHWLGYLLTVSIGLLALPLFIAAVYCSYLALFPPDPSSPRR